MTARTGPRAALHDRLRLDAIADALRYIGPHDERAHDWHKRGAPAGRLRSPVVMTRRGSRRRQAACPPRPPPCRAGRDGDPAQLIRDLAN